jgi:hypothetical protein
LKAGGANSARDWATLLTDPDNRTKAFDALFSATQQFDKHHGTDVSIDLLANLLAGNFAK